MNKEDMVSWLPEIESDIDNRVVRYLDQYHEEYQKLRKSAKKIQNQYNDMLFQMNSEQEEITLSAKEHQVYNEYRQIQSDIEGIERLYYYLMGQADWKKHNRVLKKLSKDIEEKLG